MAAAAAAPNYSKKKKKFPNATRESASHPRSLHSRLIDQLTYSHPRVHDHIIVFNRNSFCLNQLNWRILSEFD